MQFVCVTFFYISVFYRYKKHLHTKHTIKTPIFHPHVFHPHAHTHERTYSSLHSTNLTYIQHPFPPPATSHKEGTFTICIQNSRTQKILHTVKN